LQFTRLRKSFAMKLAFGVGLPLTALAAGVLLAMGLPTSVAWASTAVVLAAVLAYTFVLRILLSRELQRLTRAMERAEQGDFIARADAEGGDEVADLARRFNAMLAKITDMNVTQIESRREMELIHNELRLKAQVEAQKQQIEATNQSLEVRLRELTLLFDLTRSINSTLELGELIKLITEMVGITLGFQEFAVLLLDEARNDLVVAASYGFPDDAEVEGMRFQIGEGVTGKAAATGELILVPDVAREPSYLHYRGNHHSTGSFLAVPLKYKDRVLGVLNFNMPKPDAFRHDEVRLLTSVANQAAMAIMNARLYQQTVELSLTDPLTGTSNRRHLFSRLEMEVTRAQRFGTDLSLVMIDIDHFKLYNDRNGHPAGDEVLKGVAAALRSNVRKIDTVARYGGEEFAVILPQIRGDEALKVGDKLRRAVRSIDFPRADGQPGGRITVSVGIARYPGDAQDLGQLVGRADDALYAAKNDGRDRLVVYANGIEPKPDDQPGERRRRGEVGALRLPTKPVGNLVN
jgi:diguanylate cyclase (GGDEF)-like protein